MTKVLDKRFLKHNCKLSDHCAQNVGVCSRQQMRSWPVSKWFYICSTVSRCRLWLQATQILLGTVNGSTVWPFRQNCRMTKNFKTNSIFEEIIFGFPKKLSEKTEKTKMRLFRGFRPTVTCAGTRDSLQGSACKCSPIKSYISDNFCPKK